MVRLENRERIAVEPGANMPSSETEPNLDFQFDDEEERIFMEMVDASEAFSPSSSQEAAIETIQRPGKSIDSSSSAEKEWKSTRK